VERCLPRDRRAVVALFQNLFESGAVGEDPKKHNPIAQRHLALSALWHDTDPSPTRCSASSIPRCSPRR
jgi:hypothetical protein